MEEMYIEDGMVLSMPFSSCSIDDSMQVKITDNALARDLFPMDYHCLGDNENRPVRWMSLESLLNNDFSSASDVVRPSIPLLPPNTMYALHPLIQTGHILWVSYVLPQ